MNQDSFVLVYLACQVPKKRSIYVPYALYTQYYKLVLFRPENL